MPSTSSINAILATLTGQLHVSNHDEEMVLENLQTIIAESLLTQDPATLSSQEFLFQRSDVFMSATRSAQMEKINTIVENVQKAIKSDEMEHVQVFVRSLPIRTTQITGGTTAAGAGSRVKTVGPFTEKKTGRQISFDIVKVRKLIPLYIQGQAEPVILFNSEFSLSRLIQLANTKPELTKSFKIIPDTVWISARLFDASAPAGYYAGLRVKGGTLALDTVPAYAGDKLTITTATLATCSLNLEQNDTFDNDPSSPFGIDARNAQYQLPETFSFTFKNKTKNILAIGNAAWKMYGQGNNFRFANSQAAIFNTVLGRLCIPLKEENASFEIKDCQSKFCSLQGKTMIQQSFWGLPVAKININAPTEADGNGALIALCGPGISASWQRLENNRLSLLSPYLIGEPGRIGITEIKGNAAGAQQTLTMWQDEINPYGTSLELYFSPITPFIFNSVAKGDELIACPCNADVQTDRPVKADGNAVSVKTRGSLLVMAVSKAKKMLLLMDENILWDNKLPAEKIPKVRPYALAMHNALFTVTPPSGLVLFAELSDDLSTLQSGKMYIYFGLFSYLPTLPDPYAANLGILERQFAGDQQNNIAAVNTAKRSSSVSAWLIGLVQWEQVDEKNDRVGVSFHFATLQAPLNIEKDNTPATTGSPTGPVKRAVNPLFDTTVAKSDNNGALAGATAMRMLSTSRNTIFDRQKMDDFALLDVSSKANQMGIAFSNTNNWLQQVTNAKYKISDGRETQDVVFPIQVRGLDVVTSGKNAQAFTIPQISWEPVLNTTMPGPAASTPYDPPIGWNYYQTDGFATRIGNVSQQEVPLSPIPMGKYLVNTYRNRDDGKTYAMFNLPFGMVAISFLDSSRGDSVKSNIENISPVFDEYIIGGLQLELTGGVSENQGDGKLFEGFTFQLHNINDVLGNDGSYSNLAHSPDTIFNGEFSKDQGVPGRPAVPLERIGISGYGASTFSSWENKDALFAQTSQAFFNVAVGRTSREVVQVKSMVYPWGIRVVRTITLFRMGNGYVARVDSGWQAQSDGLFDFRYPVRNEADPGTPKKNVKYPHPNPFEIHPGPVRGLHNIRNIHEIAKEYKTNTTVTYLWKEGPDHYPVAAGPETSIATNLQCITFDCDVEIDQVIEGASNNLVPSKGVTGYVQLAPPAAPIDKYAFKRLLQYEKNTIGGPINCTIKVAGTNQKMKLDRFDVNTSQNASGEPAFAGAVRGAVILPRDGSWTLVQHARGSGDVSPMPEKLSVPLICEGALDVKTNTFPNIANSLQRIAFPNDLLKAPDDQTLNFGFLQNMNTQKVLFLTPAFKNGIQSLMSKTPPLLADAYRLMNTNNIFPNAGNAESTFGTAVQLLKGVDAAGVAVEAFAKSGIIDNTGKELFEVLELKVKEQAGKFEEGYKLIKAKGNEALDKALRFNLPAFDYPLIELEDILTIYIKYKADSNPKKAPKEYIGKFDFDVDSFANDLADTWKGRMNNLSMVVDLGPLKGLMTIKGNFNSQKGTETDFGSKPDSSGSNLPTPEIEFSDAVEAVIKILEILQSLSTGDYGDALKKGLKIAMSNSANIWEYKFEATKEIAMVRFPPEKNLYEAPTTPLKLEASMSLGVFFNAALKVTTDPSQLLPTAGAFFKFHGGLQVMCVSLAAATVYAVGEAELALRADTSPLISLTMKFGFGAQITVGLPVIANVSILFMVGIEIYLDSSGTVSVTAIMMFRGHADILGGIVGITITIEARGTIEKAAPANDNDKPPCNCKAQVTFALDISIFLVIDLSFSESWEETRQIA